MVNKLKEQMNIELKRVINKYNSAVHLLNHGTVTESIELYGIKNPSESAKRMCLNADMDACISLFDECPVDYYGEKCVLAHDLRLYQLRENKHLFIGVSENEK